MLSRVLRDFSGVPVLNKLQMCFTISVPLPADNTIKEFCEHLIIQCSLQLCRIADVLLQICIF